MAQESWKRDQKETGCQRPEGPILCANNCGFFGQPATMNMCSKCFREVAMEQSKLKSGAKMSHMDGTKAESTLSASSGTGSANMRSGNQRCDMEMQDAEQPGAAQAKKAVDAAAPDFATHGVGAVFTPSSPFSSPSASATSPAGSASQPPPPASNRCATCKKRVGLTGFKCRCGHIFCPLHRYSDKHECSFDYKAAGRESIAKANPTVVAEKITRI